MEEKATLKEVELNQKIGEIEKVVQNLQIQNLKLQKSLDEKAEELNPYFCDYLYRKFTK